MSGAPLCGKLIYCTDYTCGHYNIVTDDADPWPDEAAIGGLLGNRVCAYCVRRTKQKTPQHEVCLTGPAAQKARHLRRAQVWEETMSQASAGFSRRPSGYLVQVE